MPGRRAGLFQKYFAFIVLLVSAGLLASGAIGLYFSYQETRNSLVSLQREKALTASVRIEQFLRDIEGQLGWTALPYVAPARAPMDSRRLDYLKLLRQVPAVTEVTYLDGHGHEQLMVSRLAMDRVGADTDFSAEPRFVEARKGKTWFGPVYFRKETEPYMTIAIPEARDRPGVTVVDVNLKFIWDVVSRIRIGQKGIAYVVDEKGFLVAHPDISLVLRKVNLSGLPQVKDALAAAPEAEWREVPEARDVNGEPMLSASARVGPTNWRVFVEEPRSEVFAPLYDAIVRTVLLLLAGVVISVFASLFLARRMVQPVRALQEGAERIGAGDLDKRIEIRTGDELEDLAGRFNTMTSQLRESYADLERKVEDRTAELRETLEQQTATAEVLEVISSSPTDVRPVFDAIVRSAKTLGEADDAYAYVYDGERISYVTSTDERPAWIEAMRKQPAWVPDRTTMSGRVVLARATCRIEDVDLEPGYSAATRAFCRRILGVPMLREGVPIGVLTVTWREPGAVPEKFVPVLETFAAQAVIAIENVRLFNETKESLDQQTATARILSVISGSPTDVTPVFEAIVRSAAELGEARAAAVFRYDGENIHYVASHGLPPDWIEEARARPAWKPDDSSLSGRVILKRATVQIEDMAADPEYRRVNASPAMGRRLLGVPMMREGQPIGTINVMWEEAGPVPEKFVRLLQTFADQAVIAVENVRLFNETKESLEQQTATANVLKVISGSPTDVMPVFESIVRAAVDLAGATVATALRYDGERLHFIATTETDSELREIFRTTYPRKPDPSTVAGRVILAGSSVQIEDLQADPDFNPQMARAAKGRCLLGVPMLREGKPIGVLTILWRDPGKVPEKFVRLFQTFADQAVIAVENVRLFNETKERLEQQTATAEILSVISSSPTDVAPVFQAIVRSAVRLGGATEAGLARFDGEVFHVAADTVAAVRDNPPKPFPPDRTSLSGRVLLAGKVVEIPDLDRDPEYNRERYSGMEKFPRRGLGVPMLRAGTTIGVLSVWWDEPGTVAPEYVRLLQIFADQAVIAIENVRLFNEIQEKSRQLEFANKHKSDFLANMSHELRTPLNAIIGFSEVMLTGMAGSMPEKQKEFIGDIRDSGKHLLALINDILDLSKIEAGRMELDVARFDVPAAMDNAMTLVRGRAERHGIRLESQVASDVGAYDGDERKFKQIVLNLLTNAVKFTPEGGKVTLGAERVNGAYVFWVKDTGVGIAPEDHEKIFEEFRQVGTDIERKAEGTGLGLALTRRLVQLHSGTIVVNSAPGKGSTFTFTLPIGST